MTTYHVDSRRVRCSRLVVFRCRTGRCNELRTTEGLEQYVCFSHLRTALFLAHAIVPREGAMQRSPEFLEALESTNQLP